jgi:FMN phosphatase YigB (HAD superfamily)
MKRKRYILTEDIYEVLMQIHDFNSAKVSPRFRQMVQKYIQSVRKIFSKTFSGKMLVKLYSNSDIEKKVGQSTVAILKQNKDMMCVCLDRNLLLRLETSLKYKARFFRFQICRNYNDVKIPRHNSSSFKSQIKSLKNQIKKNNIKKLLLVDLGIFSGKTILKMINIFAQNKLTTPVTHIVVYLSRSETEKKFKDVKLITHLKFMDMYEWVDMRDLTPLGGKIIKHSGKETLVETIPYIFPWSNGKEASLHLEPKLLSVSRQLIEEFKKLIEDYDLCNPDKPMTLSHLIRSGFVIPNNKNRTLSYRKNTRLVNYLEMCLDEIVKEENRKIIIFDMDGTLYKYKNGDSFLDSKLYEKVAENAIRFIQANEHCSIQNAKTVYFMGLSHPIGLSAYLADKYGISRQDYFEAVWNIKPNKFIKRSRIPEYLRLMKKNANYKFILLSSAPTIWVHRVMKFIKVDKYFDDVYYAEDFGNKSDMFKTFAHRYNRKNCLSIGDQTKTDIYSAKKYGIKTWLVKGPEDLKNWKKMVTF